MGARLSSRSSRVRFCPARPELPIRPLVNAVVASTTASRGQASTCVRAPRQAHRRLGCDHPDCPALYPRCRGRRRVGRFGIAVDEWARSDEPLDANLARWVHRLGLANLIIGQLEAGMMVFAEICRKPLDGDYSGRTCGI